MRISDWSSDVCSSELESQRWLAAQEAAPRDTAQPKPGRIRELFTRQHIGSMAFLSGMYLFWNLWAGTNGFFFPYILRTVGDQSQAVAVAEIGSASWRARGCQYV